MANKQFKLTVATITATLFTGKKQISKPFHWKACMIDEKDSAKLVENEKNRLLAHLQKNIPFTEYQIKTEISLKSFFFDTFLSADVQKLGETETTERTLERY